jgi:hypothetical protein
MTKNELKEKITRVTEDLYPGDEITWSEYDERMFEYYYATYGKNVDVVPEDFAIVFDKAGYLTEVSLGSWDIIEIKDKKTEDVL